MDIARKMLLGVCCPLNNNDDEPAVYHPLTTYSDFNREGLYALPRQYSTLPTRFTQPPSQLQQNFSQRGNGRSGSRIWRYDASMGANMGKHMHLKDVYFGDEAEYQQDVPDYQGLEQKILLGARKHNMSPFNVD